MHKSISIPNQKAWRLPPEGLGLPRPVGGSDKVGTFFRVLVPTTLSVLSILVFLRCGFISGEGRIVAIIKTPIASYLTNFIATLSLPAIAATGTVHGFGARYLRSSS